MFDQLMPWYGRGPTDDELAEGGLANITRQNIDQRVHCGTDAKGKPLMGRVPSRLSAKMLHPDGSEVDMPLVNGRAVTVESWEKYGRQRVREALAAGLVPKLYCPISTRIYGRELVPRHPDDPATECATIGPHGCPHYIRERDVRREAARVDAESWTQPSAQESMLAMAKSIQAWATGAPPPVAAAATPPPPGRRGG